MDFTTNNLQAIIAFLTALFVTSVAIPTIVTVAQKKGLYIEPNGRTSHKGNVPLLGGLALFLGVGLSGAMWTSAPQFPEINGIFGASLVLLAIGLKDDILIIDPYKKLLGIIAAALLIIFFSGLRFTSFQGTLGINELGYSFSILFTVFIIVLVINAFNLIDGIDGLSSGVGILGSLIYGYWFYRVGDQTFYIFSYAMAGGLIAFFYFNVFGSRNKIFMGDTGALLLGMILSVLTIRFCEMNLTEPSTYRISSAPALAVAILSIPLFDTLRVFIIRIFRKQSPFKADKNHIHHIFLDLHFTHIESTIILLLFNGLLILLAIVLRSLNTLILILILAGGYLLFSFLLSYLRNVGYKVRKEPRDLYQTMLGSLMMPSYVKGDLLLQNKQKEANGKEERKKKKKKKKKKKSGPLRLFSF